MDANKLENIVSGYRINADDAAWLRALAQQPAPPPAGLAVMPEEVSMSVITAGMSAWDKQHKLGVRDWPAMLEAVFRAMLAATLAERNKEGGK